jgi:branched-chain amino acid transport system substrate-binding protein
MDHYAGAAPEAILLGMTHCAPTDLPGTPRLTPRSSRFRRTALLVAVGFALTACGSRLAHQEVVAGAGGSTVSLDSASIATLRKAAAGGAGGTPSVAGIGTSPAGASPTQPVTASRVLPTQEQPATPALDRTAVKSAAAGTSTPFTIPAAAAPVPPADAPCASPGVPLRLGQIGAFSGVAGPITAGGRTSLAVWAQAVNSRGGLACHPVVLYQVDDGADPSRAAAEVQDLVENKHVQALVGVADPLGFQGIISGAERAKIPVIGGDGIDFNWNASPYLFPTGAGSLGIIRVFVDRISKLGKTKDGLLYCVEASACTEAAKVLTAEVPKAGMQLAYSAPVSVTQADYTAQCLSARNAGVQVLGLAMDGASVARVARSCAAVNYHPLLAAEELGFTPATSNDPDVRRDGVVSATAVAPSLPLDTPGQREYHAALVRFAPDATADGMSIAIWAAGRLVEATVAGLGTKARIAPITTADLFAGLGTVHSQALGGLIPPITFTAGQRSAPLINCAYVEMLTDKGWTAPNGGAPTCARP